MMPFHFEQQPHLVRPAAAANFRVDMELYERISMYARAVACVVTVVVAVVMVLQPPPTPTISMDKVTMHKLEAYPDPTNLTVEYNFFVQMSVHQVGQRYKFGSSNMSVGVLIGHGELEIPITKSLIHPQDVESTPTSEMWTFRLHGSITDNLDTRRVQYLAKLIRENYEAVLITFVVSGKDSLFRDFKVSCSAHIVPFPYKPPAIHACDLVIG